MKAFLRMHGMAMVFVSAGMAALASGASGQALETSPTVFRCSAGPGMYNRVEIGAHANGNWLSGDIRTIGESHDTHWAGGADLWFELEGRHPAGVGIQEATDDPGYYYVVAKLPDGQQEFAEVRGHPGVEVSTALNESGILTVKTGRHVKTFNIGPAKILRRVIHCQSGTYEITVADPSAANVPTH